ncbi:hypothetical protein Tco_0972560 [Tanacetum coccineum]
MAEPVSPDHVFDFLGDDPALDIEDDLEMDTDKDPEMDIPHVVAPPVGLLPPLLKASSDFHTTAAATDTKVLHGSVRTLSRGIETRRTEIATARNGIDRVRRRKDSFDIDISFIEQAIDRAESDVTGLQARIETAEARLLQVEQDGDRDRDEIKMLKTHLESDEISATLTGIDRDMIEMELYSMLVWMSRIQSEMFRREAAEARSTESIDVLVVYGDARLPESQRPPDGSHIKDKEFQRSFRHSDTERLSRSDEVLKLKNFKKDATLKLFKSTNQERYEHVGPKVTSSQDGKVYKIAKRDYAWLMISRCSRSHIHVKSKLKEQAQA